MIRSGSTLQYQIVSDLVERFKIGFRVGYVTEKTFPQAYSTYGEQVGYKVIKTHVCTTQIQDLFARGEAIGLYSYRDIRDVAVSAMRKFEMSFEQLIQKKWLELSIENGALWRQQRGISLSKYEEMVVDLPAEIIRTAALIDIVISRYQAIDIAGEYGIEKQRARTETVQKIAGARDSFDPHTLLHYNHIFKAEIGGWKDHLSVDQVDFLEKKFGMWLRTNGYQLSRGL